MIRRPPRSTQGVSSAASDVYKRQESDRYFPWLPITKTRIKKYPYMGVATMALGAIIFLVSGGFNTIS